MNIRRKGAGMVFTATLLSALIATVAAPMVFASVTVTSAGSVPRGGASTGTATFTFLENAAACFTGTGSPDLQVLIKDNLGGATVGFSGTPVVSAPGTLGTTTATLANTGGHTGDTLNINFTNASNFDQEQIIVSGLTLNADTGAATGAIVASLTAASTQRGCVIPGGTFPADVGTATATGTVATGIGVGATSVDIAVAAGSCPFAVTGAPVGDLKFLTVAESKTVLTATAPGPTQTLTFSATTNAHAAAEPVSQTVVNCNPSAIGSPGTVANALNQFVEPPVPSVLPGQTNQPVADTGVEESTYGSETTIAGTITFTITTAGVVFSGSPQANPSGGVNLGSLLGAGAPVACSLSVDRKSCSVTVVSNPVGSGLDEVELENITVDVDTTAVLGSKVIITATTSAPLIVTSNVVAFVGRTIVSTAAQPVVFIGGTDQATGLITLTESGPGFFSSPGGPNNFFTICYTDNPPESFTRAPWAVVTTGDLKLLSGVVGVTQVAGTLIVLSGNQCAFWRIFTASTVASTIEIRGSTDGTTPLPTGANNGPRINVPAAQVPGSVQGTFGVGSFATVGNQLFSNAIRAFQNSVTVTAASQPRCLQGATDCLAGNIVVTETQNGQLRVGMKITVNVLPRATTQRMDVLLQTTSTNQTPIVTTNAAQSGLLVSPVGVTCTPSAIFGVVVCNFAVTVNQQSFGPTLGTLTFSNIHYVIAADAVNGPVNVDVAGVPTPAGNGQTFDAVVSNAILGAAPVVITTKTSASSAIGKTQNGILFTVGTKVIHVVSTSNNIATIRIQVAPALVGKSVAIEVASKNSAGVWSAFTKITTRVVGGDGFAYYYASTKTAKWLSFRGFFAGDATHGSSRSQTVQVHWVSP